MIINKADFCIKNKFLEYFAKNDRMIIGSMYFRSYQPSEDKIVKNYNNENWNKIFKSTTEDDLKDSSTCANVVILLWCDADTDRPHGMLYLEEDFSSPEDVVFHGGTWDHNPKFFREIFRSIVYIFDFILKYKTSIVTTCGIDNYRAGKFQDSLCFEEVRKDDSVIYKVLNKQKYAESQFVKMLRSH